MASAEEAGETIVYFKDSEEMTGKPVIHYDSGMSQATKAPTGVTMSGVQRTPATNAWLDEDSRIVVMFKPYAADTIESEESQFFFGILLKNKKTGLIQRRRIAMEQFTGFTAAGTVDVACTASVENRICYWAVPRGYMATLDAGTPMHFYWGDDTA
jgi:hypothetical protein